MTSVKDYFDSNPKALNALTSWNVSDNDGSNNCVVYGKISYFFEQNTKYWSFYFPEKALIPEIECILRNPEVLKCKLSEQYYYKQVIGYVDEPDRYNMDDCIFSGRVFVYMDRKLNENETSYLKNLSIILKLNICIRDLSYMINLNLLKQPLAFVSHDSRDKEYLVKNLVHELNRLNCPVWYDEYSLKVGDSLRENIENGLRKSKKCIVVLSQNFISNNGWTKAEFTSIFSREIHEQKNIILPIWHNITKEQVYNYCPLMVDRLGLSSDLGVEELAKKLNEAIHADQS
ncbi:MAG: toll/interleukin-1 receptor domain-containing protein [Cytophagales bacterium]|nr:toll/interleukin-1 receptor domain-containing protein [Cytophagales bacterium]